ncbi:hypothetical protein [Pectobacterium brasiliense]|uniref:hypothetical protein n=1 Tax=Pectobacterium brasiliense TaxID=180957 RepID=UPI00387EDC99
MWPAQMLPLPLQQVVEALNQGETPDQIIIRMNQQGLLAWRECKYPSKPNHSLLEIFRHTDYVPLRRSLCAKPDLPSTRSSPC